jgi:predicted O-linked N-acetylglucosamine transferase (SPINDLY family)
MPGVALLHNNRGNTLRELERFEEALASLDQALAIEPDYVDALNNRGNTLQDLQRYEEALDCFEKALARNPDNAVVHNNRGNILQDLQRYEEALDCFEKALARNPDNAVVHNNRGNILQDLQRYEEALASHDNALAVRSDFAEALHGRGNALRKLRRLEEAAACFEKALIFQPDYVEALNSHGNTLHELQRYEEAVTSIANALAIRPDLEYAAGMLANARMHGCDWRERDEEVGRLTVDIRAGKRSITPFVFLGVSDSAQAQLLCSRIWVRDTCSAAPVPIWNGERYRHSRIRVAYLSADFRDHVMAYCLAELFETHDRVKFETTAVSFGPDTPGKMRSRLEGAFDRFVDVRRKSDREIGNLLREMEIDIAVDLHGFTAGFRTRIFAFRSVPVQVNYLGYPGTMGAGFIDYILADRFVIPEEHHACYTEKVVYLPDTYQVNDSKRVIADRTPARTEAGLPEQGFVFCSFNNNYKISPAVFDVWMRLLGKVEGSVLWLYKSSAAAMHSLKKQAADRGIAPERLVFAPRINLEDYLARHRLADLSLDTLPYNGHATSSDALWAGLPVLTCLGASFAGRVGASLLNAIGLNELIARSLEEYEALAVELATNPKHLADIKSKLAKNRNTFPLFNTDRFRRHIEAAYTTMWERVQRGEPPESFAVESVDA